MLRHPDVGRGAGGLAARGPHLTDDAADPGRDEVGNHDVRALGGEQERALPSEAGAGAGDKDALAGHAPGTGCDTARAVSVAAHAGTAGVAMVLAWRYSRNPSSPCSRPTPLMPYPPNGVSGDR